MKFNIKKNNKDIVEVKSLTEFYQFKSESNFQEILFKNPTIIKDSIPPQYRPKDLIPLAREFKDLDNLYIDENGILYLVEVKRAEDSRGRRSVLAQVLDYGNVFNKIDYTLDEFITEIKKYNKALINPDSLDILENYSKNKEIPNIFNNCVKEGKFKLIIIADNIKNDLLDLCEYTFNRSLNSYQLFVIESSFKQKDIELSKENENNLENYDEIISECLWYNSGQFPELKSSSDRKSEPYNRESNEKLIEKLKGEQTLKGVLNYLFNECQQRWIRKDVVDGIVINKSDSSSTYSMIRLNPKYPNGWLFQKYQIKEDDDLFKIAESFVSIFPKNCKINPTSKSNYELVFECENKDKFIEIFEELQKEQYKVLLNL